MKYVLLAIAAGMPCGGPSAPQPWGGEALGTDLQAPQTTERSPLRHRVSAGTARRFSVRSDTTTRVGADCAADPGMQPHLVRPAAPVQLNRVEFIEEEACSDLADDGSANIAYRCLSFYLLDKLGEEVVFECRVDKPDDLRKLAGEPRAMLFAGLVEDSVGYTLDPQMRIKEVRLPRALLGAAGKTIQESYRAALQARYQSLFPDEPVGIGDQWERPISHQDGLWSPMGAIPELDYVMTTRFVGMETRQGFECAVLEVQLRLAPGTRREVMKNSYQSVTIDSFIGHSRIHFAIDEGMPVEEELELSIGMRRVLGNKNTLKIETPIDVVQRVSSRWVGSGKLSAAVEAALPR